jgi:hypothetical protein
MMAISHLAFGPGELKINKLQKKIRIRKLKKENQYHVQRKTDKKTMFYHTPKGTSLKNRG